MRIKNNTFIRVGSFILFLGLFVLIGFITNYKVRFFDEIFSIAIFYYAYFVTPSMRVDKINLITPKNLMLLVFFIRLVICPVSIILFGYKEWVLPVMPTPEDIHKASVISDLAFLSFVIGWDIISESSQKDIPVVPGKFRFRNNAIIALGLLIALILLIHFVYGSFRVYLNSLFYEDYYKVLEGKSKIMIYLNILLKYVTPFFGIILGLYALDRTKSGNWGKAAIASIVIILIIFLAIGPSRNNIVFPVLAFLAAIIPHYFKIKFRDFILGCIIFFIFAFIFQNHRRRGNEQIISQLNTGDKFIEFIQVYFVSPHIMTPMFLIEDNFEKVSFSLHASFLESIPVLGEKFRDRSGSYYYNVAYGRGDGRDQVFPTYGEIFFNLGYVGLFFIFILTGFIYRKIDLFFHRKTFDDPFFRAIVFYFTLVFNATIFLSYSVFGQFIFYNSLLLFVIMIFRDRPLHEENN